MTFMSGAYQSASIQIFHSGWSAVATNASVIADYIRIGIYNVTERRGPATTPELQAWRTSTRRKSIAETRTPLRQISLERAIEARLAASDDYG
jgi:hypothetical protein